MTHVGARDLEITVPLWLGVGLDRIPRQPLIADLLSQLQGVICVFAGDHIAEALGRVTAIFNDADPRLTICGPHALLTPYLTGAYAETRRYRPQQGGAVGVLCVGLFHEADPGSAKDPVRTPLRGPGVFIREHTPGEPPPVRLNERGEVVHEPCPGCSPEGWYGVPAYPPDPLRTIDARYLNAAGHEERRRRMAGAEAPPICAHGNEMRKDHSFCDGPIWRSDACACERRRILD